jgi:single-strand DNA-binding protein
MSIKNNITLIGRLVKDVDLRYTPNGVACATVTLAVQRDRKNENGDYECDFPNVVVWKQAAENLANHCQKGDMIGVQGKIQTRTYDGQNGKKVYVTEVVTNSVEFLKLKAWENGNGNKNGQNRSTGSNNKQTDPFAGGGQIDISDDDLPF